MADFDSREVHDLAKVLGTAPAEAVKDVRPVVQKGLLNIKNDARRRASGIGHAPTYPYTITYDSHDTRMGAWGEVGPDKEKQVGGGPHRTPGNLGGILEFGGLRSGPIPHMGPAGRTEEPKFLRALEQVAAKATGLQ